MILDFEKFFSINRLDLVGDGKLISQKEMDILCQCHVGFLSNNHTTIYTRSYSDEIWMKFKKVILQDDNLHLLDYWSLPGGDPSSDTLILSEGNFDIIGEYVTNSLQLKDKVRLFASGNSFSYTSLLKSVCYNEDLYKCNVVILSDDDKKPQWYNKFKRDSAHIINNIDIWANKNGNDFGTFPINPYLYKDMKKNYKNKLKY
jgi:hypothetical protein